MRRQIEIQQAFRVYERKMSRVYQELNSIKESCSYREEQLLMEGFWDKLRSVAGGSANFLSKTTQKVSNLGSDIYNKGIELGKKAIDISKELVNKVSEITKNAVASIKSAPGRLFDACKDIYASISNEVGEIYKKAKEKGGEFLENAKKTITDMYNSVAANLSEGVTTFKNWASKNTEEFKKMIEGKKAELLEASKSAESSANETVKKIGEKIKEIYEKGLPVAKFIGTLTIGMVALPFVGSYIVAKKTYELGEETVSVINSGIDSIKNSVPKIYNEFLEEVKKTGEHIKNEWEKGKESEKRPVSEKYIQTFESFVYNNY
jgi:phage-related protein